MNTFTAFLAVFGLLIVIHELGHFITAKLAGVKVMEFGIGFPPKLFQIKKGETTYTLNLIPLGGFVKMLGEEDPSAPRSLASKRMPVRALVISAGALMNALLPILLFSIVFMVPKETVIGDLTIQSVAKESPAATADLRKGDVIREVNGRKVENLGDLGLQLSLRTGATATMEVVRQGQLFQKHIIPRWNPPEGQGATGISVQLANAETITRSKGVISAIGGGARRTGETAVLMKNEVTSWFVGDSSPQLTGPVGIIQLTGEVAGIGVVALLEFAALLSINLAIINILPLPALDGGRLLFLALEIVRGGKRVPAQKEALVHLAGFVFLIAAVVIISYFDILRISRGESVLGG